MRKASIFTSWPLQKSNLARADKPYTVTSDVVKTSEWSGLNLMCPKSGGLARLVALKIALGGKVNSIQASVFSLMKGHLSWGC
jgi:hypothetical protein